MSIAAVDSSAIERDVVLAVNVVHAVRDLRESLGYIRDLLVPGGLLLLVQTNPATFRTQYNIPPDISIVGPYSRDPGTAAR